MFNSWSWTNICHQSKLQQAHYHLIFKSNVAIYLWSSSLLFVFCLLLAVSHHFQALFPVLLVFCHIVTDLFSLLYTHSMYSPCNHVCCFCVSNFCKSSAFHLSCHHQWFFQDLIKDSKTEWNVYSSLVVQIGSEQSTSLKQLNSSCSENECEDGWGHQQEDGTGTSGYGTVTQVALTASHGTNTCYTGLAALGNHVITWKTQRDNFLEALHRTYWGVYNSHPAFRTSNLLHWPFGDLPSTLREKQRLKMTGQDLVSVQDLGSVAVHV